jgi:ParB-like chromosome segregation protein Spo0J
VLNGKMSGMTAMSIEQVSISSLQADPENARVHNKKNIDAIKGSLELFGFVKPLVVWGDNVVIAGNGTLEAAKEIGLKEIPIRRVPKEWTWEKAQAFALADNRTGELADWDPEILKNVLIELDSQGWSVDNFGFDALQPPTNPEPRDMSWLENLKSSDTAEPAVVLDPTFSGGHAYGLSWAFTADQRRVIVEAVNAYKIANDTMDAPDALYEICNTYLESK